MMPFRLFWRAFALCLLAAFRSTAATHYVDLNSPGPAAPYSTWATAATNIQDAVDAAFPGEVVIVTNGVYNSNPSSNPNSVSRVVISVPITLQSVNGPGVTVIRGSQVSGTTNGVGAVRCLYLASGVVVSGFTLSGGATSQTVADPAGGGIYCPGGAVVSNLIIVSNSAFRSGGGAYGVTLVGCTVLSNTVALSWGSLSGGGGVSQCALNNCTLIGNSAPGAGGGTFQSTLVNCTLASNFSGNVGGGACQGSLSNCLVFSNFAVSSGGGTFNSVLVDCLFTGNSAASGGGASSGGATNCIFMGNTALTSAGGGCSGTSATGCLFASNLAVTGGGAAGSPLLVTPVSSCTFIGNQASSNGGGFAGNGNLTNCLFVSNTAAMSGGGVGVLNMTSPLVPFLYGCVLSNNQALIDGGGSYRGFLENCLLVGNSAAYGGGSFFGYVFNCTVVSNSATSVGGGDCASSVTNSVLFGNTAPAGANYSNSLDPFFFLSYSCTWPLPDGGIVNVTNDPCFIDAANGNFRLQSNSPCINSGRNTYVTAATDLDGNPRIVGGTVDMGAYEFQNPASTISYAWLQQYGLATDGSADNVDSDGDGMNNYAEWRAGTNPTNALSVLRLASPVTAGGNSLVINWQSVTNEFYYLQRAPGLSPAAFQTVATNISGQAGTTSFTDTNAPGPGPWFYRVGVQ